MARKFKSIGPCAKRCKGKSAKKFRTCIKVCMRRRR